MSRRRSISVLLMLAAGACTSSRIPPEAGPDSATIHAALATVTVQNLTARALTIEFRPAGRQQGRVSIGSVPAGATRRLAPVPAGEPIVLVARAAQGGALELPSRSFALEEQWLWTIAADAVFR